MAYVADPTNPSQPTEDINMSTAAAEFRSLKGYVRDDLLQPILLAQAAVDADALAAEASAVTAAAAAAGALAAGNYKGEWSTLTGGMTLPASVSHSGSLWVLKEALADITLETPGVSTKWVRNFIAAVDVSFPGATYGMLATQVQAALAELKALASSALLATRNLILNGNFNVNQRGYVSGTATTVANQYILDQWRVVVLGQSLTLTASGTGNTVTAPAGGIEQIVEARNIEGGTYVLSWVGTATALVNGVAVLNGGTFTLPANTNATFKFSLGTLSKVQVEAGTTVSPFEYRQYDDELRKCQRYLLVGTTPYYLQTVSTGTIFTSGISYPVVMRATPVFTLGGYNTNVGPPTVSAVEKGSLYMKWTSTGTGVANVNFSYILSAELP